MSSNATSLTGSIRIDAKAIASQKAGRLVFAPAQPFSAEGMVRVKATSRNSLCGGKPVTFVQVGPSSEGPDTMMLRVLSGDHPVVSDTSLDVCAEFGYAR